jgi:lipopolysaccharide/colanic/teichoic acid biosynthesis glycosyltransferase
MSALVDLQRSVGDARHESDRAVQGRPRRNVDTVLSPDRLREQLACERAMADRSRLEFSLVRLHIHWTTRSRSISTARVLRAVLSHVRNTDEVGWLDKQSLCVVLPNTQAAGAHRVAQRISIALSSLGRRPRVEICTYPSIPEGEARLACDSSESPLSVADSRLSDSAAAGPVASIQAFAPEKEIEDLPGLPTDRVRTLVDDFFVCPMPSWKRAMDIGGAATAFLVFSPVLAAAAVAVKLSSPGPVIFTQRRSGLGGRVFTIYKFRSMCNDAEQKKTALLALSEQDGPAFKLRRDPRLTRVGAFLRRTSIDELPQLWNVLKGDMSLVGPRPLPVAEQERSDRWHQRRLDVTPGMTCLWQIRGRSSVTFDQWVRMDVEYISSRSIWGDLKILLQTIPAILFKRGF